MFEKFFKLKEHGTNVRTEVIAWITTFLTMAYILAVLFILKYIFI
jgi:AGZA family xanthine/uracil permease-like MFS transporter